MFADMMRVEIDASDVEDLIMQSRKTHISLVKRLEEAMTQAEAAKSRFEQASEQAKVTDNRVRKLSNAIELNNQIHKSLTGTGLEEDKANGEEGTGPEL